MKILVIGTGYVGLVTGTCLANLGHNVTCFDIDKEKIEKLNNGFVPFFEPGLSTLVKRNIKNKNLTFLDSIEKYKINPEIIFIAVGTPPKENGEVDLKYVYQVVKDIGKHIKKYTVIVNKSTVPVGTAKKVAQIISKNYSSNFDVVSNPEFLREGSAIFDFNNPDRIVVGASSKKAELVMKKLYKDFSCPKVFTSPETSEIIKYASNAFLATKISFINEIANVCDIVGADVREVAEGMGFDKRIGRAFLNAGLGYGGSCFPKDVRALSHIAEESGYDFKLLRAVIEVNNSQREYFYKKIIKELKSVKNKKIAVLGLAFKPDTDDVRESIAIDIVNSLIKNGANVFAYDPQAINNAKLQFTATVQFCNSSREVLKDADCALIMTEWNEFKNIKISEFKKLMKKPVVIDGRNIFDPKEMKTKGVLYICMGRN